MSKPPKRAAPQRLPHLSAQATAANALRGLECLSPGAQYTRVTNLLREIGVPHPEAGPVLTELHAYWKAADAKRRRAIVARLEKPKRGLDSFVEYAWKTISPATRAKLTAREVDADHRGDLFAREFARTLPRIIHPLDWSSFLDELIRI